MILGGHNSICNIRHLVACIRRLLGTSRNWRTRSEITEDEDPREEVIIHLPIPRGRQYKRYLQARQKLGSGNESKILHKVNGAGVCAVFCAGGCGLVGLICRHKMVDSSRLFVIQCQSFRNETTRKCRGETNLFPSSVYSWCSLGLEHILCAMELRARSDLLKPTSVFFWKISWTTEAGGLRSIGLQRVRHDWACMQICHKLD